MGIYSSREQSLAKSAVYSALAERPSAVTFGVGRCQIGSVIYNSDGTNWTTDSIEPYTWANLPTASNFGEGTVFVSDVGVAGSLFYSDGVTWSHSGGIALTQDSSVYLVPSLAAADAATYSQELTVITVTSASHGIPDAIYNGANVYLDLDGGDATGGWFTDFTYLTADTFTCVSTESFPALTPDTGTVKTKTAAVAITPANVTIPGNLLGSNGVLEVSCDFACTNSANDKTVTAKLDTTAFTTILVTTVEFLSIVGKKIRNCGSAAKQLTTALTYQGGGSTDAPVRMTVNTAVDKTVSVTVTLEADSEYVALMGFDINLKRA